MEKEFKLTEMAIIRGTEMVSLLSQIISEEILDETSYNELERLTLAFDPSSKKRQHAIDTVQITQLKIVPYVGTKSIFIKALVRNTDGGHKYDSQVFFSGVNFDKEDNDTNVSFTASDGKIYHIKPIRLSENNIRVRCNCLDFRHRFAYYNFNDGSLWGRKFPPYHRKTDTRPPVNKNKTPGVCKHLIKTIMALKEAGLVRF